ncbi:MAG: alternative ribosome rescue aminoacyl-tRNA hydrolase ArfB [Marinilabilia sp.]
MQNVRNRDFKPEWRISATRSSGAGGQNVNKVNTKIELRFSVPESSVLTDPEKELLMSGLSNKLTKNGELIITAENERSQQMNKEQAIERFFSTIEKGLRPVKKRTPTRPSRSARARRLEEKRKHSEKKSRRRDNDLT